MCINGILAKITDIFKLESVRQMILHGPYHMLYIFKRKIIYFSKLIKILIPFETTKNCNSIVFDEVCHCVKFVLMCINGILAKIRDIFELKYVGSNDSSRFIIYIYMIYIQILIRNYHELL